MSHRLRRVLVVALAALIVAYGLFGFLVAPGLLRHALLDALGRTLTTTPSIARVRVNPFALSLTVEGLRVPDAHGDVVVGLDRLYLRFDPLGSLFTRAWTLAAVRLEKPAVALEILPDRTLNLAHLVRPQPADADTAAELPAVRIRRLSLVDGSLGFADRSRAPAFARRLGPVRLELADFGTRRGSRNAATFAARTGAGETLDWSGRFALQPFRAEGELRLGGVRAKTLADFLGPDVPYVIAGGTFDLATRYLVDAAKVPAEVRLGDLAAEARGAILVDRAAGDTAIAVERLTSRGGRFDLGRWTLDLGRIEGRDARVLVAMLADGQLALQRWAAPAAAADTAAPLAVAVDSARVANLALLFEDRRLDPPARIGVRDGRVDLSGFSTAPGASFHLAAACSVGAGGRATAVGAVMPAVPSADLALEVRGFELRAIEPYLQAFARLELKRGSADAKGRLQFNRFGARGPLLRFSGEAASRDFAAVDRKVGAELLSWRELRLTRLEYDALPGRLVVGEIAATRPFLRLVIAPDRTTNVQAAVVPPDSVPAAFRPVAGQPDTMPVRIGRVRVRDGAAWFADLTMRPNFATGIQGLSGEIRELSSSSVAHAAIELAGRVDAYAPVRVSGTINPLNSRGRTDVAMNFQNIELTTFTPYAGKFMGYRIEKGKLDLDLHYRIENRKLDATNHVLARQFTLGEKVPSPDATKLPVRFAVALLKDRQGNIDLNLPVKGDLDDPKFSVFPIVMKVLVGLVSKAVTSPFALFGALFDGQDATPAVSFAYGSAELDSTAVRVLGAVRQGLADRPGLRLEIAEPAETPDDSLALHARAYAALLRATPVSGAVAVGAAELEAARALAPAPFAPEEWAAALVRTYVARFGRLPALEGTVRRSPKGAPPDPTAVAAEARRLRYLDERVRGLVALDPVRLHALPRMRARRVQGFVLADSTIAPERVFVTGREDAARSDSAGVRVRLTLSD
jgi:hypothetical protein